MHIAVLCFALWKRTNLFKLHICAIKHDLDTCNELDPITVFPFRVDLLAF